MAEIAAGNAGGQVATSTQKILDNHEMLAIVSCQILSFPSEELSLMNAY